MKHQAIVLFTMCVVAMNLQAQPDKRFTTGITFFLGGRYDNMRMCVASPAGTKGGPIADIQVTAGYYLNDNIKIGCKIPVMRPLLFAFAFNMLQFEPEITFRYEAQSNKQIDFILESGLGVSLHYGPDYRTKKDAENPERFFAAGPLFSVEPGIGWRNGADLRRAAGIKLFYVPLFARERTPGTVLGAAVEGQWDFASW